MNCYDELVHVCDSSSERKIQLLRFSYQKDRTEELFYHLLSKAQLLYQIKSSSLTDDNPNSKLKVLREFNDSTYSTRYIKEVFVLQKSRISAAQNGFPLLDDVFKKDKNQYLKEIIGHILKKVLD